MHSIRQISSQIINMDMYPYLSLTAFNSLTYVFIYILIIEHVLIEGRVISILRFL